MFINHFSRLQTLQKTINNRMVYDICYATLLLLKSAYNMPTACHPSIAKICYKMPTACHLSAKVNFRLTII